MTEAPAARHQEVLDHNRHQTSEGGNGNGRSRLVNIVAVIESQKVVAAAAEEENIECIGTPVEGRGDPTSTMLHVVAQKTCWTKDAFGPGRIGGRGKRG